MIDPLAPHRDAFWTAIDERLAAVEQGLSWLDLAQARQALLGLPGDLRMLGLTDIAALAEQLWQGFQSDARHADRLSELARLRLAVLEARATGGGIPIVTASQKRCLLVVSTEPAIADLSKNLSGWRRIVAKDAVSAAVWLRRGDIHAVVVDPDCPGVSREWLAELAAQLPLIVTAPSPGLPPGAVLPTCSREGLQTVLSQLP